MSTITTIAEDLPYRILGNWQGYDEQSKSRENGSINYGFTSLKDVFGYLDTMTEVARKNKWNYTRIGGTLSVSAPKWSHFTNFEGTYQVAQYLN